MKSGNKYLIKIFEWFYRKRLDYTAWGRQRKYKVVKVTGWRSAIVDRAGQRQHIWFEFKFIKWYW